MKDKSKPFLSKRSSSLLITLAMLWVFGVNTYAADCNCQGCCSGHDGVVCINGVTMCKDGHVTECMDSGECIAEGCPGCIPQKISVSPPAFSDPLNIVAMIDAPGEFTTGLAFDGIYLWSADSGTKKIYKLSTAGEVMADFDITGELPFGIAYDGTSLWYSEFVTGKIYKTDTTGKNITSFASPGGWSSGLAFDGTYLYSSNFEAKKIYRMDTSGNIISSFASPGDYPTGLAFDGTYLWNSDSKSGKVYKLDTSGNIIAMFEPYLLAKPYGIAFDGNDVWIADDDTDKIYKLSFTSPVIKMGESKKRTFIVSNSGNADLHVSKLLITGKDSADFSVQNDRCTGQIIPATRSDNFDIVFSPMSAGEKSAMLEVYSDDPDTPAVKIPLNGVGDGLGCRIDNDLWIRAVIHSEEKGDIEAVWYKGGQDKTQAGDQVIWGYFYASPDDVNWGSKDNPDVFVKIWFDRSGRLDVNFFHVSVPDIEVYSDYHYDGTPDEQGTTTLSRRYIRQYYEDGKSDMEENEEDGIPLPGDMPKGNPSGYSAINDLRIGAVIATVEKGAVDALWHKGGDSLTEGGHQVLWGYFYANPDDVNWGSENNPDLFVKVWFDASGRLDVNFFHVSVPDIEVCSDFPNDGTYNQKGTAVLSNRYIWQVYQR